MKKIAIFLLVAYASFGQKYADEIAKFREEYRDDFLKNEKSPIKKEDLDFLRFYEPNEKFKVIGKFTRTKKSLPFPMPTSTGKMRDYVKYGELYFKIDEKPYKLAVYRNLALTASIYTNYLFVPFRDLTNGKETYGGGRYIDLQKNDIKRGKITLDFNKCYNPYCAFSTGYSCPIPPKENHLTVAIEAGEKNFGKEIGSH